MYQCAEGAWAALDLQGQGYITENQFLSTIIVKDRVPFTKEQIQLYFNEFNIFPAKKPGIDFDSFKKAYFPHLYLV